MNPSALFGSHRPPITCDVLKLAKTLLSAKMRRQLDGIERQVDEARDVQENLFRISGQRLVSHFQIMGQKLSLLPRFSYAPHPKHCCCPDIASWAKPQVTVTYGDVPTIPYDVNEAGFRKNARDVVHCQIVQWCLVSHPCHATPAPIVLVNLA